MTMQRRDFLKVSAAGLAAAGLPLRARAGAAKAKVVIVGAGFGGATAAKYIRMWDPGIEVTLIDREPKFVSCPLSNLVLAGLKTLDDLTQTYDALKSKYGVNVVVDTVTAIDTDKRMVRTEKASFAYDRLILSPGIDFRFDQIEGYDAKAQQTILHAWKAGEQTLKLRQQVESMKDGGVIVVGMPLAPYRCPPGPYERVCLIANYLKRAKPKSKIIMLDANPDVASKKPLFMKAWNTLYKDWVEYRPNSKVVKVDAEGMIASTEFEDIKAAVINIIPPQRAGQVAELAGVRTDSNGVWCPASFVTYESKAKSNVHVIGDALLSNFPKSGHMANNMGKVCANAVVELLNGRQPDPVPVVSNTCYSAVSEDRAIHVATVFRYDPSKEQMTAQPGGGISSDLSEEEAVYAEAWAEGIWSDTFL
ncbi:MAG: FCSD flavin-binding domain-containing protein [Thiobacillus sp.]